MSEDDRWNFGDGVFGDRLSSPATARQKFGQIVYATGWHEHASGKVHRHEQGNKKHKHGSNDDDLGEYSDGTLRPWTG